VNGHDEGDEQQTAEQETAPRRQATRPAAAPRSKAAAVAAASGIGAPAAPPDPAPTDEDQMLAKEADLMWTQLCGEDHPKCLSKKGLSPDLVDLTFFKMDGPLSKVKQKIDAIVGSAVTGVNGQTPGEALWAYGCDSVHIPLSNGGPALFEVRVTKRYGGTPIASGMLSYSAPDVIHAQRMARQRVQHPQPGVGAPQPFYPGASLGGGFAQPQPQNMGAPQHQPTEQPMNGHGQGGGWPRPRFEEPASLAQMSRKELEDARSAVELQQRTIDRLLNMQQEQRRDAGVGGAPEADRRRRYEDEEREEELAEMRAANSELRAELAELRRAVYARPGVGATPTAVEATPAPRPGYREPMPPPPPQYPRGPQGEVWVEGVGWCLPARRTGMGDPTGGAAPAAVQPVAQPPQPAAAAQPAGVATMPGQPPPNPMMVAMERMQHTIMRSQEAWMTSFSEQFTRQMEKTFKQQGMGAQPLPEPEPEPELSEEEEKPDAGYDIIDVPDATIFGQPAKYARDRKTGNPHVVGTIMSNPGLIEKGTEMLGKGFDALGTLAKRVAVTQQPAGVGEIPPHIEQQPQQPAHQPAGLPSAAREPAADPFAPV